METDQNIYGDEVRDAENRLAAIYSNTYDAFGRTLAATGSLADTFPTATPFNELSHVANVLEVDGADGMWSDYAHKIERIAENATALNLSSMVSWNNIKFGNKCCPHIKEWMP